MVYHLHKVHFKRKKEGDILMPIEVFFEVRRELVGKIVEKTVRGDIFWQLVKLDSGQEGLVRYTASYDGWVLEISKIPRDTPTPYAVNPAAPVFDYYLKVSEERNPRDTIELKGENLFARVSLSRVFNAIKELEGQKNKQVGENLDFFNKFIKVLNREESA